MKLFSKVIISIVTVFMITGYVYATPVVYVNPPETALLLGETFDIDLMIGDDESELPYPILSVSVGLTFDPTIIRYDSFKLNNIWEGVDNPLTIVVQKADEFGISTEVLNSERNHTSNVLIATLTFETIGSGSTTLVTSDANLVTGGEDFLLGNYQYIDDQIEFQTAVVRVDAVPVPSSLFLLGSGIFAVLGILRRER